MRRFLLLGFLIIHLVLIPVEGSSRSSQSSTNFPIALAELYREVPNEQQSAFGSIVQRLTTLYHDGAVLPEADASIEQSLQLFMQGPYLLIPDVMNYITVIACVMETEGPIDFGVDLGRTQPEIFEFARHNPEDHSADFEVIIGLRFLFADRAMRQLSETIQSIPFLRLNPSTRLLQQFFRTTSESSMADFLASEASNNGSISRFPSSLMEDNFLLSANLKWDHATQSFVAGQHIGVMAIAGQQFFKQIPARLEITNQSRGGDSFTLLLLGRESAQNYLSNTWYFFQKRNNVMASLSSNQEFNDAISRMNISRRRIRPGGGLPSYSFILAPSANMFEFFNSGGSLSLEH